MVGKSTGDEEDDEDADDESARERREGREGEERERRLEEEEEELEEPVVSVSVDINGEHRSWRKTYLQAMDHTK